MKIVENTPVEMYQDSVKRLADWFAECYWLNLHKEDDSIEGWRVCYALKMAKAYTDYLLKDQEELGFEKTLCAFTENNAFKGFEWKNGAFLGDETKAKGILQRFVNEFPKTNNHYQYEVAVFLQAVADTLSKKDGNKDLYPKHWQAYWKEG